MKRGLIIFSNNMEDAEGIFTRDLLIRAGLKIDVASSDSKDITTAFGLKVKTDYLLSEISPSEYDFLVIPGGKYVMEIINNDKVIKNLILEFHKSQKLIAAICAAPRFLGQLGLLSKTKFTCYPGCEIDMPYGIYQKDEEVVKDKNIITARSVAAVVPFCAAIIDDQLSKEAVSCLLEEIVL
ncbi:DJ-1/PfpI family protein [Acholeplasma sp. OttesenSCG-928-E16]|nr:DJ-1/PfpI family protein [Acholeplasma sp. OttesenSCG-928-E16]